MLVMPQTCNAQQAECAYAHGVSRHAVESLQATPCAQHTTLETQLPSSAHEAELTHDEIARFGNWLRNKYRPLRCQQQSQRPVLPDAMLTLTLAWVP